MANYKLIIQYDGTLFSGYQIQHDPNVTTVQGELQKILSMIFDRDIQITCAGRTDRDVHALGQVITFNVKKDMDTENLKRALNGLLGGAITVSSVELMPPRFHARFTATTRKYVYMVDNSPEPHSLLRTRAYWVPLPLDVDKVKRTAKFFEGRHNFIRFAKNINEIEKPVRDLDKAEVLTIDDFCASFLSSGSHNSENGKCIGDKLFSEDSPASTSPVHYISQLLIPDRNIIFFYFEGKSFLHSMVRIMVGNLIKVGIGVMKPEDIKKMLEPDFKVKSKAANVPGHGLYLVGVGYGETDDGHNITDNEQ